MSHRLTALQSLEDILQRHQHCLGNIQVIKTDIVPDIFR